MSGYLNIQTESKPQAQEKEFKNKLWQSRLQTLKQF